MEEGEGWGRERRHCRVWTGVGEEEGRYGLFAIVRNWRICQYWTEYDKE